jgi:uncharacterized SAM-dependent methyltransferase
MHLEARRDVEVRLPDAPLALRAADRIHTENSYKYSPQALRELIADAGFAAPALYTDEANWFVVALAAAT